MRNKRTKKTKKKFSYIITLIGIKLLLISFILYGLYGYESSFSNKINLLAVSENEKGDIVSGSVIGLNLKIKPGTGQIFTRLNTIEEIDTQISIINSQKIACNLFNLDCNKYDFYYEFDSSSLILKGPSASSAIAILTAKTVNKDKIKSDNVVITGSLNSGGIVGVVGGVDKKIQTASANNFKKVLIPAFSTINSTIKYSNIEIIKTLDIIDAYNEFNGDKYSLKTINTNEYEYKQLMKSLSEELCKRAESLELEIELNSIKENSTKDKFLEIAKESINSSNNARASGNYYSVGSFCYNANINLKNIIEIDKNQSLETYNNKIQILDNKIQEKINKITSDDFKKSITTMNDFYAYLVLIDRTFESKEIINQANKLKYNKKDFEIIKQVINKTTNETINKTISLNESDLNIIKNNILKQKQNLLAHSTERLFTVTLWEEFIDHSGSQIKFTDEEIKEVCQKINIDLTIKSELLNNYDLHYFDNQVNEQIQFQNPNENQYLCIYKGLELNGKINTVLSSIGIDSKEEQEYVNQMVNLTKTRINLNSDGDFPLIPTIYSEYAIDLYDVKDYSSSMLYSNYALAYSDLNIYLKKENNQNEIFKEVIDKLFENILFIVGLLMIIAFLE